MRPGTTFFVVQCFDRDGYFCCVLAETPDALRVRVAARTNAVKQLVACSIPFQGMWTPGGIPEVSLPPDMRPALAHFERLSGEDE